MAEDRIPWREARAQVWDRTPEPACHYCGVRLHPIRDFTVDHVVPISKGGSNDLSNLVACCSRCNYVKLTRDQTEHLARLRRESDPHLKAVWLAALAQMGQRLAERRVALGFTRAQIAARSGISIVTITSLERGSPYEPRAKTVKQLAEALDVSREWLRHGIDHLHDLIQLIA